MKKRTLTVGSILVAVICLILILWQIFGFLLINSNGRRCVDIDDNNRKVIEQLISKNIETDETLPDMDNAINIEWQTLMHKDQIVINYGEEDDFVFYITNRYENTLIEYIKDNGKVVYFETAFFIQPKDVMETEWLYNECAEYEVIGNITDNPELLEVYK